MYQSQFLSFDNFTMVIQEKMLGEGYTRTPYYLCNFSVSSKLF